METINTDILRGRVDIFILKALSENDGYGYDILNYIRDRTEGHYEMKQSSVYSVLKRLEKSQYVRSYMGGSETNGAKRRYYSLTESGKEYLENEEKEWSYTRTLLDNLVTDKEFDLQNDTPPFKPSDLRPLTRRTARTVEETLDETEPRSSESAFEEDSDTLSQNTENLDAENPNADLPSVASDESAETLDGTNTGLSAPAAETEIVEKSAKTEPASPKDVAAAEEAITSSPEENGDPTPIFSKISVPRADVDSYALKDNYKDFYDSIYADKQAAASEAPKRYENVDCSRLNDLVDRLRREGITLKNYSPATESGTIKYVFANKITAFALITTFIFFVLTLLILKYVQAFAVSNKAISILAGLGTAVFAGFELYLWMNAKKKRKDNLKINRILTICGIVYLAFFVMDIVIALLVPNGNSINSPAIYAPCVPTLVIPFFGLIFAVIYKSKKFHIQRI